MAAVPEPEFERHILDTRAGREDLTTDGLPPACTLLVGDAARPDLHR
jgi:hypothetical protein